MKQYGISSFEELKSELDYHLENIKRRGFTVLKSVFEEEECKYYTDKIEEIYVEQEKSFGRENLDKINELDISRMLFAYDDAFLDLITNKAALEIVKSVLGENFILQLQNGIINRNKQVHHQTSWHRDIPYQEYTTSSPISLNVFFCMSPFNPETGGTVFLPYSHLFPKAPSVEFMNENSIQPSLNPGDVIVFDSWVYHKAGNNISDIVRYGVNHVYTTPILKQQINIPNMLGGRFSEDPQLAKILGYTFNIKNSVDEYRKSRLNR